MTNTHTSSPREAWLFYLGWGIIFFGAVWGSTVGGLFFLLLNFFLYLWQRRGFTYDPLYLPVFILIGTMLVSATLSDYPSLAFTATFGFTMLILLILTGAKQLASLPTLLHTRLLPLFLCGGASAAVVGLFRYFHLNLVRLTLPTAGPNLTGSMFLAGIIITWGYYQSTRWRFRYLLLISMVLQIIALVLTLSRGAWLGFFVAALVYINRSWKRFWVVILVLLIFFSFLSGNLKVQNRFASIFNLEDNTDRLRIWQRTIKMIKDYPLFGVGAAVYPEIYPAYRNSAKPSIHKLAHAHNIFLQITAEFGGFGLVAFLALMIMIFRAGLRHWQRGNSLYVSFFATWVGWLVHQQFDCLIWKFNAGVVFWLFSGLLLFTPLAQNHTSGKSFTRANSQPQYTYISRP